MRAFFSLIPIMGSFGFFFGAYAFYSNAKDVGTGFYWASGLFLLCGLGFVFWGLSGFFKKRDESVSQKEGLLLKQTGTRITAQVFHLEQKTNVRVNNRSPYIIHAKGLNKETGQEQVFKSGWIFSDVFLEIRDHKEVPVYIERSDPSRYYMDLESIGIAPASTKLNTVFTVIIIAAIVVMLGALGFSITAMNKNPGKADPVSTDTTRVNTDTIEAGPTTTSRHDME